MSKAFTIDDISINDGWVSVNGIGTVGLWWKYFDKKCCIQNGVGESFIANDENEVKNGVLNILNTKNKTPTNEQYTK